MSSSSEDSTSPTQSAVPKGKPKGTAIIFFCVGQRAAPPKFEPGNPNPSSYVWALGHWLDSDKQRDFLSSVFSSVRSEICLPLSSGIEFRQAVRDPLQSTRSWLQSAEFQRHRELYLCNYLLNLVYQILVAVCGSVTGKAVLINGSVLYRHAPHWARFPSLRERWLSDQNFH